MSLTVFARAAFSKELFHPMEGHSCRGNVILSWRLQKLSESTATDPNVISSVMAANTPLAPLSTERADVQHDVMSVLF